MTWYAVFDNTTGSLKSTGSVIVEVGETEADAIVRLNAKGLGVKTLPGDPRSISQVWNETTREFDPFTPPPITLDKGDFLALFTEAEREDLFEASRKSNNQNVRRRLQAFFDWLKIVEGVDLGDPYVETAVNGMESASLIGNGRAAFILAGGV